MDGQAASCPRRMEPRGLGSHRDEDHLRAAVRAAVRKTAPEDPLDGGPAPRLHIQAERWGGWGDRWKPQPAARGWALFSRLPGRSVPGWLLAGRGHRCPFSSGGGFAAWSGGRAFRMPEGFPGFQIALGSSRGRSRDPRSVWFAGRAGNFQAPECGAFSGNWIEAGAEAWGWNWVACS